MRSICFVLLVRTYAAQNEVCTESLERDHVSLLQMGLQLETDLQAQRLSKQHTRAKPSIDDQLTVLQEGLQGLTSKRNYNRSLPVFVTMLDSEFLSHLRPWCARLSSLGLTQQVIISLDREVDAEAARYALPAMDSNGTVIDSVFPSLLADAATKPKTRRVSNSIAFLKMATAQALLAIGFEEVISTEMDVFFFQNPLALLNQVVRVGNPNGPPCIGYAKSFLTSRPQNFEVNQTQPFSADYVAMPGLICSNIGFMKFQGFKMGEVLVSYLNSPEASIIESGENLQRGEDSVIFNNFLREHSDVTMGMLPSGRFASMIQAVQGSEAVIHLSDASLDCKHSLLNQLYDGTFVTSQDIPEAATEYHGVHPAARDAGNVC